MERPKHPGRKYTDAEIHEAIRAAAASADGAYLSSKRYAAIAKRDGLPSGCTVQRWARRRGGWRVAIPAALANVSPNETFEELLPLPTLPAPPIPTPPPEIVQLRYVVTWAQNATPLHDDFWASLLAYCEHTGARLVVVKGRYRNPTSMWTEGDKADDWWDPRIAAHETDARVELADGVTLYGDIPIQPTAVRPLTGLDLATGHGTAVFGHPKIQLRAVARATTDGARVMTTTGACTAVNYTASKAGKKAAMHHVFGACVVEHDGRHAHVRQINAEADGAFTDLAHRYTPEGVEDAPRAAALVMGDIHVAATDAGVVDATLRGPGSIAETLRPERVVLHDVLDFRARNHHSIHDPDARFARHHGHEIDNVEAEVRACVEWIDRVPAFAEPVVVPSNHDAAFDRWLREADPKKDPENAVYYHRIRAARLEHHRETGEWLPALELAYRDHGQGRARMLRQGEGYRVHDIECGCHGDAGTNGSRGTALAYSRLGVRTIIGHSHTPQILDGCYQVGCTAELDQGYNTGPSSWMHAHCIIYANGKRSLIFVQPGGRWRA